MKWEINTSLPVSYQVKNCPDLFGFNNLELASYCPVDRTLLVIDDKVAQLYLPMIEKYFAHHEITYQMVIIDGVETNKDLPNLRIILQAMEQFGMNRKSEPLIGIGGGVIQDLVGLAASLYRRGIPYIRVPTTLLGIVDVSVAAKVGINYLDRRNRLGGYYPPQAALLDKSFIATLPEIEISSGLGEIFKMAIIKDAHLFELLEQHGAQLLSGKFTHACSDEVINLAVQGMKEELENNLWEKNLKRCVDFGHSFSPIIEMRSLVDGAVPSLTHGYAVALDCMLSCIICCTRGMLDPLDTIRVIKVAKSLGLPTYHPSFGEPTLLWEALMDTCKHRNGDQNLPAPTQLGQYTFINDLTYQEVVAAAHSLKEYHHG